MGEVKKVLVVGGGVGGLSATKALRDKGIDVDVVERNPKWDVYGVGIIQPGNAVRALDVLGLADEVVRQGWGLHHSRLFSVDGTMLAEPQFEKVADPRFPPANGITRPRLHKILQDGALGTGADIRTGVTFESIDDKGDSIEVRFTDGDTRSYDLLIGADGIDSAVRKAVFGDAIKPRYSGQVVWRYNMPRADGLDGIWQFYGPRGAALMVPLAEDLMYLGVIEAIPEHEIIQPDDAEKQARLDKLLIEAMEPYNDAEFVVGLKKYITDPKAVNYRPADYIVVPAPWHRGRVLLIGDAAHATTPHCGQGAAQAIEDAIVIAEELDKDQSLDEALAAHMARRYERCQAIVEGSLQIGRWQIQPEPGMDPIGVLVGVTRAAEAPL
jgi:2-polyprenyl-6-methoxyphenol hydroxylase-like FAD-dependent oxidoreductase